MSLKTYHVDKRYIQKGAGDEKKSPTSEQLKSANEQTDQHTEHTHNTGDGIEDERALQRDTGASQDGKVADFVWQLVTQDGDGCAEAGGERRGKRGADCQAVGEVVQAVAHYHHPSDQFDV